MYLFTMSAFEDKEEGEILLALPIVGSLVPSVIRDWEGAFL